MNQRPRHILVIDDSQVVRKILEVGLRRSGLAVETFEDGVAALRSLQEPGRSALPDLIILDVLLPKMDGYQVARHLKTHPDLAGIPIVMLSRSDGVVDRLKGRLAGARAYVTKPFQIDELVQVIGAHMEAPRQPGERQEESGVPRP